MAIKFSLVTVRTDKKQGNFLVAGVPHSKRDLENWVKYQEFEESTTGNINVSVKTYLYGEGEEVTATVQETAYMNMRLETNPSFLETRCKQVSMSAFLIGRKDCPRVQPAETVNPEIARAIEIAEAILEGERARDRGELDVSEVPLDTVLHLGMQRIAAALYLIRSGKVN